MLEIITADGDSSLTRCLFKTRHVSKTDKHYIYFTDMLVNDNVLVT